MKKLKILALLAAAALFFSCSNASSGSDKDDDIKPTPETTTTTEESGDSSDGNNNNTTGLYTPPELPTPVGEDPFKGKIYVEDNDDIKYVFSTDGKMEYYKDTSSNAIPEYKLNQKFDYTYNATEGIFYARVTAISIYNDSVLTYPEIVTHYKALKYEDMVNPKNPAYTEQEFYNLVDSMLLEFKTGFETLLTWKVDIQGNTVKILNPYFSEKPDLKKTIVSFKGDDTSTFISIHFNGTGSGTMELKNNKNTKFLITDIKENEFTAKETAYDSQVAAADAPSYTFTYSLSKESDGRWKIKLTVPDNTKYKDFLYTQEARTFKPYIDNGLDPSINYPNLEALNLSLDTSLRNKTFTSFDTNPTTLSFDGYQLYTNSFYDPYENRTIMSKFIYLYDSQNKILYSRLYSTNEVSESGELQTFDEIFYHLNSLSYDEIATQTGGKMTPAKFELFLSLTLAATKEAFETLYTQHCEIVAGTNGNPDTCHVYNLYPDNTSISNTALSFRLASINDITTNEDNGDGDAEIDAINSTPEGSLSIPFIKDALTEFVEFDITEVTANTITVISQDSNSTESYTLSYTESCNNGIITLFFAGITDISNAAPDDRKDYQIPTFKLSSDKATVYTKVNTQS